MTTMLSQTNTELLGDLIGPKNERAWSECYQRYAPLVIAFVKRMGFSDSAAADVLQETFIAVSQDFLGRDQPFDRSKGRFKSWLCGVARNKALDVLKKGKAKQHQVISAGPHGGLDLDMLPDLEDAEKAERRWEEDWRRNLVRIAMDQIAMEFGSATVQAANLLLIDSLPAARVAKLLGKSTGAIHLAKHRVLKRLRQIVAALVEKEG